MALAGLVGCIFPVIPGPPLSFLAIVVLSWAKGWQPFSSIFLITMGGLAIFVTLLDSIVSMYGAKKYGASKLGIVGAILGMIAGIFFFPPFGMLLGAICGALAGELLAGKGGKDALRAGWGVFVGNMMGTGIKMAFCGVMLFFYIREMF